MSWFSSRTLSLLNLALVNGYSFGNILRIFKLVGVPYEIFEKFDTYPRTSKSELVGETLSSVDMLPIRERNYVLFGFLEEVLISQTFGPQYPKDMAYQRPLSRLEKSLKLDSFEIRENKLVRLVEKDLAEEETLLETTLKRYEFNLVIHHLNKSKDHFINEEWDSANSQTRKTLEALTQRISEIIADKKCETVPKRHEKLRPVEVRKYLRDSGFLDDKELNLLITFYQYASEEGGHPGLSSETDARLRRFMLIGLCQFYLEKLKNYLRNTET